MDDITRQLEEIVKHMKCYNCGTPTDRYITFMTTIGIVNDFECIDCRQRRVQRQVDEGLRPASDLLLKNLPERHHIVTDHEWLEEHEWKPVAHPAITLREGETWSDSWYRPYVDSTDVQNAYDELRGRFGNIEGRVQETASNVIFTLKEGTPPTESSSD